MLPNISPAIDAAGAARNLARLRKPYPAMHFPGLVLDVGAPWEILEESSLSFVDTVERKVATYVDAI